jgi:GT2 family glycosyltransferase
MMQSNSPAKVKLSVIIVNYNTLKFLHTCLESLNEQRGINFEVIVVDNCSTDEEQKHIQTIKNENTTLILSDTNLGFGRANNLAVLSAKGEHILILNPDTKLIQQNTLLELVNALEKSQHALISPRIEEPEKNKTVTPKLTYPSQKYCKYTNFTDLKGQIAWVLGACMLIRKTDYLQIGGFDGDFFMYGEDVDFCFRIRKEVGSIGYASNITIEHIGGASEKTVPSIDKWKRKREGAYLFFYKNYHSKDMLMILKRQMLSAKLTLIKFRVISLFLKKSNKILDNKTRAEATLVVAKKYFRC